MYYSEKIVSDMKMKGISVEMENKHNKYLQFVSTLEIDYLANVTFLKKYKVPKNQFLEFAVQVNLLLQFLNNRPAIHFQLVTKL